MRDSSPQDGPERAAHSQPGSPCRAIFGSGDDGVAELVVSGSWTRLDPRPGLDEVLSSLPRPMPPRLRLREHGLTAWDSTLLALLWRLRAVCREEGILLDASGLGRGLRELLQLAAAAPERAGSADSGADRKSVV